MCNDYCGNQNLKASQDLLVHGLCIFKLKFPSLVKIFQGSLRILQDLHEDL